MLCLSRWGRDGGMSRRGRVSLPAGERWWDVVSLPAGERWWDVVSLPRGRDAGMLCLFRVGFHRRGRVDRGGGLMGSRERGNDRRLAKATFKGMTTGWRRERAATRGAPTIGLPEPIFREMTLRHPACRSRGGRRTPGGPCTGAMTPRNTLTSDDISRHPRRSREWDDGPDVS